MKQERIMDPASVDRAEIEEKIAAGIRVTLQFSRPGYSSELLRTLNNLSGEFGRNLVIRFYGFYGQIFNASCLKHLPEVVALSVDCLFDATNLSALSDLKNLRYLSLGVFHFDCPNFLESLQLENVEQLAIHQTAKSNFDLSPLRNCTKLKELVLANHTSNIDCLGQLPALRDISLCSIPKRQKLGFVSRVKSLKRCKIVVGGRSDISEINHQGLEELEIIRVQGFSNLDNLNEFPSLRSLKIEDQIRLRKIDFSVSNKDLQALHIWNCKSLDSLEGLRCLANLYRMFIGKTALDIDSLLKQKVPPSLKVFNFSTGKVKQDADIRQKLNSLGYREK